MPITETILIQKPLNQVWDLFVDAERMTLWQPTLVQRKQLQGQPMGAGSRAELTYDEEGRKVSLVETVTHRSEEFRIVLDQEVDHVKQVLTVRFDAKDMGKATEVVVESELTLSGPFKMLAPLLKTAVKNRLRTQLEGLKRVAESQG